jgi:endonuclease VIII
MAEGDTILRAARRIEAAIGGQTLRVGTGNERGRAGGVEHLDGRRLDSVEAHGKHLLLAFGDLALHSHLGMNGAWHVYRPGERWRRRRSAAWAILGGESAEAVQFGGPMLRVLPVERLSSDPLLSRLGPDVLAADLDLDQAVSRLRPSGDRQIGDAMLDQHLIAGIGNIFKSEACFAARVDPWRPIAELTDEQIRRTLEAARRVMSESVEQGRTSYAVYKRAGRPCPVCGGRLAARGQGDANRRTYWCPRCQSG